MRWSGLVVETGGDNSVDAEVEDNEDKEGDEDGRNGGDNVDSAGSGRGGVVGTTCCECLGSGEEDEGVDKSGEGGAPFCDEGVCGSC